MNDQSPTDGYQVTERTYSDPDPFGYRRLEAPKGGRITFKRARELGLVDERKRPAR